VRSFSKLQSAIKPMFNYPRQLFNGVGDSGKA
jgi:hypothetical protein